MKIKLIGKANEHERKNRKHLKFLTELPCAATGIMGQVHAHHLRRTDESGMGLKSPDKYAIPLNYQIHYNLHHNGNEIEFLRGHGIDDPIKLAEKLWELSGDIDAATDYIMRNL